MYHSNIRVIDTVRHRPAPFAASEAIMRPLLMLLSSYAVFAIRLAASCTTLPSTFCNGRTDGIYADPCNTKAYVSCGGFNQLVPCPADRPVFDPNHKWCTVDGNDDDGMMDVFILAGQSNMVGWNGLVSITVFIYDNYSSSHHTAAG